jgi:hypothetical protein
MRPYFKVGGAFGHLKHFKRTEHTGKAGGDDGKRIYGEREIS